MTRRFPVNKSRVRRVRPRPPTVSAHALGVKVSARYDDVCVGKGKAKGAPEDGAGVRAKI